MLLPEAKPAYMIAIEALKPDQLKIIRFLEYGWLRSPLPHEQVFLDAYISIIANPQPETLPHSIAIFKLTAGIDPKENNSRIDDILRNSQNIEQFKIQIQQLESPDFVNVRNSHRILTTFYRFHVRKLVDSKLLFLVDPQTKIADKLYPEGSRPLTTIEQISLFENQIRKLCCKNDSK